MDGIDSLQTSAVLYSNTYYLICKTKIINTVFRIKKRHRSRSRRARANCCASRVTLLYRNSDILAYIRSVEHEKSIINIFIFSRNVGPYLIRNKTIKEKWICQVSISVPRAFYVDIFLYAFRCAKRALYQLSYKPRSLPLSVVQYDVWR